MNEKNCTSTTKQLAEAVDEFAHLVGKEKFRVEVPSVKIARPWLVENLHIDCQIVANQPVVELVSRIVVSSSQQSSSPRLDIGVCIFLDLFQDFRRCAFSERRRSRRLQGACGEFVNLKMMCRLSITKMLIG